MEAVKAGNVSDKSIVDFEARVIVLQELVVKKKRCLAVWPVDSHQFEKRLPTVGIGICGMNKNRKHREELALSSSLGKRLRVLISAFSFSPSRGSEGAVGWNIATLLARDFDVTVLTGDLKAGEPYRKELEEYALANGYPPGISVRHVRPTNLIKTIEKLHHLPGQWWLYYHAYRLWQLEAYRVASRLHDDSPFALCHQLTFIGYREPGYLWKLGIPFFWGPIAGADTMPPAFYRMFSLREIFRPLSRDLLNHIQKRTSVRARRAARTASKIWVVSESDKMMVKRWGCESDLLLETGAANPGDIMPKELAAGATLKMVWSGLMVSRKAFPLMIEALARATHALPWQLDVLGDGPLREQWTSLANNLGLHSHLNWHGNLPRSAAMEVMNSCHVLVHTGLREGTPHVVIEALSLGLPVICHDACGMGVAVNSTCGIKIPLLDPETSIKGFASAILQMRDQPGLLARFSAGALERARQLGWTGIAAQIANAYRENAPSIP